MVDKGKLASYSLPPLSKISNLEHTSHFKLIKDLNSNKVNDLALNKNDPVNLYNNLLTILDTDKIQNTRSSSENDN